MADTSPRPWKRNDNTVNAADGSLVAVLGTTVGDAPWAVRARHDGDFIVQAVNAQAKLLDVLEHAEEAGNAAILLGTSDHSVGEWFINDLLPEVIDALAEARSEAVSA